MKDTYDFNYTSISDVVNEIDYQADLIDEEGFSNTKIKNNLIALSENIKRVMKNYDTLVGFIYRQKDLWSDPENVEDQLSANETLLDWYMYEIQHVVKLTMPIINEEV
jgi:hypothetical protein